MESALAVANYFVKKSLETGVELTPMKLVKLVYIAHGWHLAIKEEPLIDEAVEAWEYGPVVPSVYRGFRQYYKGQITSLKSEYVNTVQGTFAFVPVTPMVTDEEKQKFLDEVWNVYNRFNGLELSSLTHQKDTPWDKVWNSLGGKQTKSEIIPNEIIREHYVNKN